MKEEESSRHPQLIQESKILKGFEKIVGFPKIFWVGQENRANYMVMELMGPSLEDLFFMCEKTFCLKTVLMLADQMVSYKYNLASQDRTFACTKFCASRPQAIKFSNGT